MAQPITAPHPVRGAGGFRRARTTAALLVCALLVWSACDRGAARLEQAQALYEQGQFTEAETLLKEILDADPSNAEANYKLGTVFMAQRKHPQAIWPLRKAAESGTDIAPQAGLLLANLLLGTEEYEEAINVADAILAEDESRSAARIIRAQAEVGLSRWDDAIADAEILMKDDPRDYATLHTLTTALAELGRYDEAEKHLTALYEVALEDFPIKAPNICASIVAFLDEIRDQREAAKKKSLECFDAHPDSGIVLDWVAYLHDGSGEPEVADEILTKATDIAPHRLELWKRRSDRLIQQGHPVDAAEVLHQAADLLDTPAAWGMYAEGLRLIGEQEKAVAALERGIEVAGEDESMSFLKADLLVNIGRDDEARALAETFDNEAYRDFVLSRLAERQGDLERALALVESGLEIWPNNAQARYNAGLLAQRLGKVKLALEHYREATRSDPEATDAALRMAELLLATGEYRAANDFAIRQAQNRPWDPDLFLVAAEASVRTRQYDQARNVYTAIIRDRQGLVVESQLGLAFIARESEGPAAAAAVIREAAPDWSDAANDRLLFALVGDLAAAGKPDEAAAELDAALAKRPKDDRLLEARGRLRLSVGDVKGASADFDRAVALAPGNGAAIAGQAAVLALSGHREAAIERFDASAKAEVPSVDGGYGAAQLVMASGDLDGAAARLRAYLLSYPGAANAANDLAWILASRKEDLDTALDLATRAVRIAPSGNTWDTLGAVQMARGVPKLAVRAYQRGVSAAPDDASLRYRLGVAEAADGNQAAAAKAFKAALERGGFAEEDEARTRLAQLEQATGSAQ